MKHNYKPPTPQCEPMTLMLVWLITPMRRLSKALVRKAAKVLTKAMVLSLQETPIPLHKICSVAFLYL